MEILLTKGLTHCEVEGEAEMNSFPFLWSERKKFF